MIWSCGPFVSTNSESSLGKYSIVKNLPDETSYHLTSKDLYVDVVRLNIIGNPSLICTPNPGQQEGAQIRKIVDLRFDIHGLVMEYESDDL